MNFLLVAIGGAVGSVLRYGLSVFISERIVSQFPWGTFTVNLSGSLIIGIIGGFSHSHSLSSEAKLLLFAGLLGGFTTFSSLALEGITLIRNERFLTAALYITLTNLFGLLLAWTGFHLALLQGRS